MNCVRLPDAWRPGEQPVVEAEDGDDGVVLVARRPQGGMVMHAQVAPVPDDRGHVSSRAAAAWR